MYLLLALACRWTIWHILPLIPFSTINNTSGSVNRSNFTLNLTLKSTCHAIPNGGTKQTGSISFILGHIFRKFSNRSTNKNAWLWTYRSWVSPNLFYFKIFTKSFLQARSLHHSWLGYYKMLIFLIMKFRYIFYNHPKIHTVKHPFATIK